MRRVLAYLPPDGAGLRSQAASGVAAAARAFASLPSDLKAQLSDPDLLKHQSYVGGRWIDSQSGQTIEVGETARRRSRRRRCCLFNAGAPQPSPTSPVFYICCCNLLFSNQSQVLDPATGKPIARVPNCGGAETRQAIAAAETQFKEWGRRPGKERANILRR